jgi:glycosyltransferase involved in cell wall biosynthesis
MARAIAALHGDAQHARQLGRAARQEVDRRFSIEAMVAAYQQVYAPALCNPRTGR